MLPIFRITPEVIRSQRAFDSWAGHRVNAVPAVKPLDPSKFEARQWACSLAHAAALQAFLRTTATHGVILEDDAVLVEESWLSFTAFDLFHPFSASRKTLPPDTEIVPGLRPDWGAQAYIVSRSYAFRAIPLLQVGWIADHVDKRAGEGLAVAHFRGNSIHHDHEAASLICEERRQRFNAEHGNQ